MPMAISVRISATIPTQTKASAVTVADSGAQSAWLVPTVGRVPRGALPHEIPQSWARIPIRARVRAPAWIPDRGPGRSRSRRLSFLHRHLEDLESVLLEGRHHHPRPHTRGGIVAERDHRVAPARNRAASGTCPVAVGGAEATREDVSEGDVRLKAIRL